MIYAPPAAPTPTRTPATPYRLIRPWDFAQLCSQFVAWAQPVALDIETTGLHMDRAQIITIAIASARKPDLAYIIDTRSITPQDRARVRSGLAQLLSGRVEVIGANLKFDIGFLAWHFGVPYRHARLRDLMLQEQLLLGGLPRMREIEDSAEDEWDEDAEDPTLVVGSSLKAMAARIGITMEKEARDWFIGLDTRKDEWNAPLPAEQLRYAGRDVSICFKIAEQQKRKLQTAGLMVVNAQIEQPSLNGFIEMEVAGIQLDVTGLLAYIHRREEQAKALLVQVNDTLYPAYRAHCEQVSEKQTEELADWQDALAGVTEDARLAFEEGRTSFRQWKDAKQHALSAWRAQHPRPPKPEEVPDSLNINSHQQLLLALALAGVHLTNTRKATLERSQERVGVIKQILKARKYLKLVSSFGASLAGQVYTDGRVHPQYHQLRARTGRVSCSDPNLQQLPARDEEKEDETKDSIRRHIVAAPGHALVSCDFSNIEARIVAELSEDPRMMEIFAQGRDLHSETARFVFGLPPDADPKETRLPSGKKHRDAAKTFQFATIYGAGPSTIAAGLGCTEAEATGLLENYFALYASVPVWRQGVIEDALRLGYSVTRSGRRRYYDIPKEPKRWSFVSEESYFIARKAWWRVRGTAERQAGNHTVQGLAADIAKTAIALLVRRLPEDIHLVAFVHDELLLEAPTDRVEEAGHILAAAMKNATTRYLHAVDAGKFNVVHGPYWMDH